MLAKKLYLVAVCFLAPLTALKLADIEPIELFLLFSGFIFFGVLTQRFETITIPENLGKLQRLYLLFLLIGGFLACLAVRLPVYPPAELSFLKTPPFLSFSRLIELSLCMYGLLLTSNICRNPDLLDRACGYYIKAGVASSLFGLLSWVIFYLTGFALGGSYGDTNRIRGAFIEGGPFGVYLVSVLVVLLFRKGIRGRRFTRLELLSAAVLILTFFLASSKAGMGVAVAVGFWALIVGRKQTRIKRRYIFLSVVASIAIIAVAWLEGISGYVFNYEHFSESVASRPDDASLMMGRLMAVFLVPRMIEAHPITGIGLANYSVMRNDPHYLDGLPTTNDWDLPGLGLLGYAAELGIPATMFLIVIIWKPVRIVRSRSATTIVVVVASYQMFAHLFGTQITFFYPWLVSSFALGRSFRLKTSVTVSAPTHRRDSMNTQPVSLL